MRILIGGLAALVLAGCSNNPAASTTQSVAPKLVGAWRSKVQFTDGPLAELKDLEFLYSFNQGGTMTESSNYDGAPPVPPAYGSWKESSPGTFDVRYVYFNTKGPATFQELVDRGGWMPNGYGELTEEITVDSNGSVFKSELKLQMFDRSGKPVEGGGKAKGLGTRIQP